MLGVAGCLTARSHFEALYGACSDARLQLPYVVIVSVVGTLAAVSAVVAVTAGSTAALATYLVMLVALWGMSTVRHLRTNRSRAVTPVR